MNRPFIKEVTKVRNVLTMFLILSILFISVNASAEWVNIAENNRSVCYADTNVRRTGDLAVLWVMYDYKSVQESQRSGRRYLSEKSQMQIDCKSEQGRVLLFTWHTNQKGTGNVVYTSKKPTSWEPTSAPNSFGNALWKFACKKK